MKRNLPPARNATSAIVLTLLALALCVLLGSGCATQRRSSFSAVPSHLDSTRTTAAPLTNINSAGTEELEKLPGVGPGIAERIIAHREQYGPFRRAEHLLMVRGISDNRFRQLRTMIVVE